MHRALFSPSDFWILPVVPTKENKIFEAPEGTLQTLHYKNDSQRRIPLKFSSSNRRESNQEDLVCPKSAQSERAVLIPATPVRKTGSSLGKISFYSLFNFGITSSPITHTYTHHHHHQLLQKIQRGKNENKERSNINKLPVNNLIQSYYFFGIHFWR